VCCMYNFVCDVDVIFVRQVPQDPDVLPPQRNGCRVEIVGGVACATSLEVGYFTRFFE